MVRPRPESQNPLLPQTAPGSPADVKLVLSDFGVSRTRANLDGCRGYVGTPGFMAPEILESFGEETYTHKVRPGCLVIRLDPSSRVQCIGKRIKKLSG